MQVYFKHKYSVKACMYAISALYQMILMLVHTEDVKESMCKL